MEGKHQPRRESPKLLSDSTVINPQKNIVVFTKWLNENREFRTIDTTRLKERYKGLEDLLNSGYL